MFTIEKDIPIPTAKQVGSIPKYPFCDMNIGDSFVVKKEQVAGKRGLLGPYDAAKYYGRTNKKKFVYKINETKDEIRIWRTE